MSKSLLSRALVALMVVGLALPALSATAAGNEDQGAPLSEKLEQDAATLDPDSRYGAFVHFEGLSVPDQRTVVKDSGLDVARVFRSVDVIYGVGTLEQVLSLRDEPGVTYLEADRALQYYGDTAPWATRARVAQRSVLGGPYNDSEGKVVNGSDVGVAVVDSGVDGLHPDLANRMAANYKVICSTPLLINSNTRQCFGPLIVAEDPYTDATGGHGTHVAGIVAGDGSASRNTFKGVAPRASLYGFGVGEGISILYNSEAFQYMLDNYDSFHPRIKVINNSYGDRAGTPYDPDSVFSKLTRALVERGVTVVFAAGNGDANNDGGTGADDRLSSMAKDPTPGVVTVANYDDDDTGTRAGSLSSSSSRGKQGDPVNYPDISAPGSGITSTCRPTMPLCDLGPELAWAPNYARMSGTSMAAPHIAGAAALLYQAAPGLTPAQVEDVLQDSAHKFTSGGAYESDPQNPDGTTSFDKGAGLLDVPAALDLLGIAKAGTQEGLQTIVTGDRGDYQGAGAADIGRVDVAESADGLTYTVGVRDVTDVGATGSVLLRLYQNVDGKPFITGINVTSGGAAPAAASTSNTAVASFAEVNAAANEVSFYVPFDKLGDPAALSPGHNAYVLSYQSVVVDMAPGGLGPQFITHPEHADAYTIFRAPEVTVGPSPTTISFTDASASSGQFSDSATLQASLVDDAGLPLVAREVTFELAGSDTLDTITAMTDENGIASVDVELRGTPETRVVSVSYAGEENVYLPAEAGAEFVVLKEDSVTTLTVEGRGSRLTLVARVVDGDDETSGVAREIVEFFADGASIGIARTDSDGYATFTPPRRIQAGHHDFEAVFEETDHHLSSRAEARS